MTSEDGDADLLGALERIARTDTGDVAGNWHNGWLGTFSPALTVTMPVFVTAAVVQPAVGTWIFGLAAVILAEGGLAVPLRFRSKRRRKKRAMSRMSRTEADQQIVRSAFSGVGQVDVIGRKIRWYGADPASRQVGWHRDLENLVGIAEALKLPTVLLHRSVLEEVPDSAADKYRGFETTTKDVLLQHARFGPTNAEWNQPLLELPVAMAGELAAELTQAKPSADLIGLWRKLNPDFAGRPDAPTVLENQARDFLLRHLPMPQGNPHLGERPEPLVQLSRTGYTVMLRGRKEEDPSFYQRGTYTALAKFIDPTVPGGDLSQIAERLVAKDAKSMEFTPAERLFVSVLVLAGSEGSGNAALGNATSTAHPATYVGQSTARTLYQELATGNLSLHGSDSSTRGALTRPWQARLVTAFALSTATAVSVYTGLALLKVPRICTVDCSPFETAATALSDAIATAEHAVLAPPPRRSNKPNPNGDLNFSSRPETEWTITGTADARGNWTTHVHDVLELNDDSGIAPFSDVGLTLPNEEPSLLVAKQRLEPAERAAVVLQSDWVSGADEPHFTVDGLMSADQAWEQALNGVKGRVYALPVLDLGGVSAVRVEEVAWHGKRSAVDGAQLYLTEKREYRVWVPESSLDTWHSITYRVIPNTADGPRRNGDLQLRYQSDGQTVTRPLAEVVSPRSLERTYQSLGLTRKDNVFTIADRIRRFEYDVAPYRTAGAKQDRSSEQLSAEEKVAAITDYAAGLGRGYCELSSKLAAVLSGGVRVKPVSGFVVSGEQAVSSAELAVGHVWLLHGGGGLRLPEVVDPTPRLAPGVPSGIPEPRPRASRDSALADHWGELALKGGGAGVMLAATALLGHLLRRRVARRAAAKRTLWLEGADAPYQVGLLREVLHRPVENWAETSARWAAMQEKAVPVAFRPTANGPPQPAPTLVTLYDLVRDAGGTFPDAYRLAKTARLVEKVGPTPRSTAKYLQRSLADGVQIAKRCVN